MVQAAQEPAAFHHVLDVINALPCCLRTWGISHPEKSASDELHHEREGEGAAPNVTPASAAGNVFVERVVADFPAASALVEPIEQALHANTPGFASFHATGIFSAGPAWKF